MPVAHGEAQLRTRWFADGAQVVLDTCGVKVLLPGISDPDTLRMAADLCGEAAFKEHGLDYTSRHDVMTPDMIRQLPAGHALIVRGSNAPVVARLGAAWRDPAYKRARHRGRAIAVLPTDLPDSSPDMADDDQAASDPPDAGPASSAGGSDDYPWG